MTEPRPDHPDGAFHRAPGVVASTPGHEVARVPVVRPPHGRRPAPQVDSMATQEPPRLDLCFGRGRPERVQEDHPGRLVVEVQAVRRPITPGLRGTPPCHGRASSCTPTASPQRPGYTAAARASSSPASGSADRYRPRSRSSRHRPRERAAPAPGGSLAGRWRRRRADHRTWACRTMRCGPLVGDGGHTGSTPGWRSRRSGGGRGTAAK